MSKQGPIVLIEDDADDHQLFIDVIAKLQVNNRVAWFNNCDAAKDFLLNTSEQPFLIFCDINLPRQNGIEFKKEIDDNDYLRRKSIPFVFYSTSARSSEVEKAYCELSVQGFFQKPMDYNMMKETLKIIIDYWKLCRHPNE